MPSGRRDSGRRERSQIEQKSILKLLRLVAAVALTLALISLLALVFAPKDPGTLTMYGLVIGINLLICLSLWPASKLLERLSRDEKES